MSDTVKNRFLGSKKSKKVTFMDQDLEIVKLSINQVLRVQTITKEEEQKATEDSGIKILLAVIKEGASELNDLTQEQMQEFPMESLSELANQIMEFSGLLPKEQLPAKE